MAATMLHPLGTVAALPNQIPIIPISFIPDAPFRIAWSLLYKGSTVSDVTSVSVLPLVFCVPALNDTE